MTEISDRAGELEEWWQDKANEEIERTVPKATEYGADDLYEIGRELVACGVPMPAHAQGGEHEAYTELGLFFYEVGKFARWRSAVRRGERISDDTLFDIGIYIRMAQRNRAVGGWPFAPNQAETIDPSIHASNWPITGDTQVGTNV